MKNKNSIDNIKMLILIWKVSQKKLQTSFINSLSNNNLAVFLYYTIKVSIFSNDIGYSLLYNSDLSKG